MVVETSPLFIGGVPGGMEMAVILLIAVLLFGANKIPKLARSTGEAMGEFKKGREEVEQELQEIQQQGEESASSSEPVTDSTVTDETVTDDSVTDTENTNVNES